jgi:hypothetical protein
MNGKSIFSHFTNNSLCSSLPSALSSPPGGAVQRILRKKLEGGADDGYKTFPQIKNKNNDKFDGRITG